MNSLQFTVYSLQFTVYTCFSNIMYVSRITLQSAEIPEGL